MRATPNGSNASSDHTGNPAGGPTNGKISSCAASTPGIVRSTRQMSRPYGSPPALRVAPAA